MPQLFTLFGLRFMFYSNDHEPIHVHVVKGGAEARFQVEARRAKAGRVYCGGEQGDYCCTLE